MIFVVEDVVVVVHLRNLHFKFGPNRVSNTWDNVFVAVVVIVILVVVVVVPVIVVVVVVIVVIDVIAVVVVAIVIAVKVAGSRDLSLKFGHNQINNSCNITNI